MLAIFTYEYGGIRCWARLYALPFMKRHVWLDEIRSFWRFLKPSLMRMIFGLMDPTLTTWNCMGFNRNDCGSDRWAGVIVKDAAFLLGSPKIRLPHKSVFMYLYDKDLSEVACNIRRNITSVFAAEETGGSILSGTFSARRVSLTMQLCRFWFIPSMCHLPNTARPGRLPLLKAAAVAPALAKAPQRCRRPCEKAAVSPQRRKRAPRRQPIKIRWHKGRTTVMSLRRRTTSRSQKIIHPQRETNDAR